MYVCMYVPVYEMYVCVYLFVYHTNGAFTVLCSFLLVCSKSKIAPAKMKTVVFFLDKKKHTCDIHPFLFASFSKIVH